MIKKQKITVMISAILLLLAMGAVEGAHWWITPLAIVGAAICVVVGGLTKRQTDAETVLKEYGIK